MPRNDPSWLFHDVDHDDDGEDNDVLSFRAMLTMLKETMMRKSTSNPTIRIPRRTRKRKRRISRRKRNRKKTLAIQNARSLSVGSRRTKSTKNESLGFLRTNTRKR